MFTAHHDAKRLPTELEAVAYRFDQDQIAGLNVSASRDKDGKIHVTLCNLNPNTTAEVSCELKGAKANGLTGRVLTAPAITSHNTFDQPETVKPAVFTAFKTTENGFIASLPAKSVVVLEVQ
jgi:alpha-N-arabinofuranosidase